MLRSWMLKNFKSINAKKSIDLAPLTLLCGANSSGKSSVLQSMLLIKQTLEHSPAERAVALNGPLVQLGTFSDILNDQSARLNIEEIGIGWDIEHLTDDTPMSPAQLGEFLLTHSYTDFSFDTKGPASERATLELQPDLKSACISAVLDDANGEQHDIKIEIERATGRGRRIQYDSITLGDDTKLRFRVINIDAETKDDLRGFRIGQEGRSVQWFKFPISISPASWTSRRVAT